jgi:hypothetical protein
LRFARREPDHIMRLIQHIDFQHGKDQRRPDLTNVLIHYGMLRPDGTRRSPCTARRGKKFPRKPPRSKAGSGLPMPPRPAAEAENSGRRTKRQINTLRTHAPDVGQGLRSCGEC